MAVPSDDGPHVVSRYYRQGRGFAENFGEKKFFVLKEWSYCRLVLLSAILKP
ncbi:hypothetical protein GF406_19655 [candidate division KSB1 bacterium]|nr:hypothetical protein [candidate division KSB1 bacterium]